LKIPILTIDPLRIPNSEKEKKSKKEKRGVELFHSSGLAFKYCMERLIIKKEREPRKHE
jgi:hypothetical protein